MAKIWLPIHEPTTNRDMLILIPNAGNIDSGQLREIIAAQTERTLAQLKAQGPKPVARLSREEVKGALREFIKWRNQRRKREVY